MITVKFNTSSDKENLSDEVYNVLCPYLTDSGILEVWKVIKFCYENYDLQYEIDVTYPEPDDGVPIHIKGYRQQEFFLSFKFYLPNQLL